MPFTASTAWPCTLQPPELAWTLPIKAMAPCGHKAQPALGHSGGRAAACPSHSPQLLRAGHRGGSFPDSSQVRGRAQQPRSVREGAALARSDETAARPAP